jgi:diaminohydroxyphosphoribosylaminopyrimidine deaminase/5-amino-6-(5-phosphoribosylamino)uracil reductase
LFPKVPLSWAVVPVSAAASLLLLQVVVGVGDPNPLVASEGIATLEDAGIEVVLMDGPERQAAYELNAEFMARMLEQARKAAAARAKAA